MKFDKTIADLVEKAKRAEKAKRNSRGAALLAPRTAPGRAFPVRPKAKKVAKKRTKKVAKKRTAKTTSRVPTSKLSARKRKAPRTTQRHQRRLAPGRSVRSAAAREREARLDMRDAQELGPAQYAAAEARYAKALAAQNRTLGSPVRASGLSRGRGFRRVR